jgi:hypothetical protein
MTLAHHHKEMKIAVNDPYFVGLPNPPGRGYAISPKRPYARNLCSREIRM